MLAAKTPQTASATERALLRAEEVDVFALSTAVDDEIAQVLNRPSVRHQRL